MYQVSKVRFICNIIHIFYSNQYFESSMFTFFYLSSMYNVLTHTKINSGTNLNLTTLDQMPANTAARIWFCTNRMLKLHNKGHTLTRPEADGWMKPKTNEASWISKIFRLHRPGGQPLKTICCLCFCLSSKFWCTLTRPEAELVEWSQNQMNQKYFHAALSWRGSL